MKAYKWANNSVGWIVFAIAAFTYLSTIESTVSFWDCGEFISSAYKLEVGHPPGNPIFMMTANLFTQLTSDPSMKAMMVNSMSAIFSALTILFLFWTITHFARKIIVKEKREINLTQIISILGCGAVGALAYTFSDTFWFSAVEGEVYAFSSLMTALVFWLILKWEDVADEPHADRWLILIAYLMGISIAVHLLNLLCIPAIVLVYYFKKYPNPDLKGSLIALLISFVLVIVLLFGIIQGLVKVAGWFELLFVNGFGFAYNTGVAFYIILVFGILCWGIWETVQDNIHITRAKIAFILAVSLLGIPFLGEKPYLGIVLIIIFSVYFFYYKKVNYASLNSILIALLVITIGYSSYALIMIRSAANTPMDQNSPEDIFTLRTYLSREQYGETPLIYGQTYASETKWEDKGSVRVPVTEDRGPIWAPIAKVNSSDKDRYFIASRKTRNVYYDELNTLFPRMYSRDPSHIQGYKEWADIKGERVRIHDADGGGAKIVMKPTFIENLRYFFKYQVNYMYWRYFMWNFSGRQNDIQGSGEVSKGNWITGIKFIDAMLVGPQEDMPDDIVNNKGHNKFYLLPLLLGILGILFHLYTGKQGTEQFWITFLLFFMTGLAIVIYLNQTPYQPRERDYAYAGSFYAFCIWIGLGVAMVIKGLNRIKIPPLYSAVAGSLLCLLIPLQMVSQTWDDHDRSNRSVCRDFGYNYLISCEPNAIIFTMGDNDTFPLWYGQEVEGYRRDVRVCNLSYLQTDWYIDQMKRQAYESDPLPISWKRTEYIQGKHDVAYFFDRTNQPIDVSRELDRVKSDDLRTKTIPGISEPMDNIRSHWLYIPVDSAAVMASGIVNPQDSVQVGSKMLLYFGDRHNEEGQVIERAKIYLGKEEMMVLDMLSHNGDWSRPFYYATTVSSNEYVRLDPYFRQDGVVYRIMPYRTDGKRVDTDILFDNLVKKYRWGNLEHPGIYLDENSIRMAKNFRLMFGMLARHLVAEGKNEKAREAMDYGLKVLPDYNIPYDNFSMRDIAAAYYQIGEFDKAKKIYDALLETTLKNLDWFTSLNRTDYNSVLSDVKINLMYLGDDLIPYYQKTQPDVYQRIIENYSRYVQRLEPYLNSNSRGGANR
jgi:hypothetical protein